MIRPLMIVSILTLILGCNPLSAAELRLLPSTVTLTGSFAQQPLLAVQMDARNVVLADRTLTTKWTSSAPAIVTIDAAGMLHAVGDGTATITGSVDGQTATSVIRVEGVSTPFSWSFRNHVQPIMTRMGCNSGACHGALAGKGGFKLSLRAYDPVSDHFAITRQAQARRVDLQDPAKSLLIRKATRTLPHGGGTRFGTDSREYRILNEWVAVSAMGIRADEPTLSRIDVFPTAMLGKPGDKFRVIVRAFTSDGRGEDVTDWVRFGSSEDQVAGVDEDGNVTIGGHGEAAITIGYGSFVATVPVTSPFPNRVPAEVFTQSPRHNFIDEQVLGKLRELNLPPSPTCDDRTFIRRLFLDSAGILPTPAEVERFVKDTAPDKRAKLIDAILERPEFVDYWTYKWCDLLLVSTRKLPQQAMWAFYRQVRESVAANQPWDRFAREILTAKGSTLDNGGGNFYVLHQDVADRTESTAVTFLGMSITCARCHNHPLERWTQDQYWSMANLFSRVSMKNGPRPGEVFIASTTSGDAFHPRHNVAMPPTPLDGKPLTVADGRDRRAYFVDWLTAPQNPFFAKALINRVWRNYLGRGLVESEDDLRETNPPSNRALFDALTKDFIDHRYDVKHLMRTILNSAAYQRSSQPIAGNAADDRFYSRYLVRRLTAEVVLDAYAQVTAVPTPFTHVYNGVENNLAATANYPIGLRAMQLPDSRVASPFLDTFGRPEREQTCSCERQQDSSVGQALHLNNGKTLNDKLRAKESRLQTWLSTPPPDAMVVRHLFHHALSRDPSAREQAEFQAVLTDAKTPQARREAIEDLFWAVLTGKEFLFNH